MPNYRSLVQRWVLDVEDLPDPHGINIVQIARFDSEDYEALEGRKRVNKTRHLVFFVHFPLPLRLNNTRLKVLAAVLGSDMTEDWVGRKVGLVVGAGNHYGSTEMIVTIHPVAVDQQLPLARPSPSVSFGRQASLPAAVSASGIPGGGSAVGVLGKDTAARICYSLACRGMEWSALMGHLRNVGAHVEAIGREPFDAPSGVAAWARQLCAGRPVIRQIDMGPYVQNLVARWTPPPAPALPPATEVVDRATGEVTRVPSDAKQLLGPPDPIEKSDIPF